MLPAFRTMPDRTGCSVHSAEHAPRPNSPRMAMMEHPAVLLRRLLEQFGEGFQVQDAWFKRKPSRRVRRREGVTLHFSCTSVAR